MVNIGGQVLQRNAGHYNEAEASDDVERAGENCRPDHDVLRPILIKEH